MSTGSRDKSMFRLKERIIEEMARLNIGNFLIGLSIGAGIGLTFAPRSGRKTRARIAEAAASGVTQAKECGDTVRDTMLDFVEQNKDQIARQKEGATEAIKQGAQAYKAVVS